MIGCLASVYAKGPDHGTEGRQAQLTDSVFHNSTFHIPHASCREAAAARQAGKPHWDPIR